VFFNREQIYRRPGVREKLLAQHLSIGKAVISGNADQAEKAAATHIKFVFETVQEIQKDSKRLASSLRRVKRASIIAD
jgi:GntR family transcriptional repressor for pyruvate dehydrogenase complex